jgi:DNA-binding transcriptional LysR family regulator
MVDWDDLRHFAALSRHGTLLAAARALGVEHATIARRVTSLERRLGLRLVDRRGRKLMLTADGERVAVIAARMEIEAHAAELLALAARSEISGTVTVSAPPALTAVRLVAPLARLLASHPGLILNVLGDKRLAQLDRRDADIAVRLSRPSDGELAIVRLGTITFHFYASSAYLSANPEAAWSFIAEDETMSASPQMRRLTAFAGGRPIRLRSNTAEAQLAAAKAGAGVAILPDFIVGGDDAVIAVDDGKPPLEREVWLAVHVDLRTAPAVRAVVDGLKEAWKGS